jgi:acyl-[acyl-carrier-protein] desaturase
MEVSTVAVDGADPGRNHDGAEMSMNKEHMRLGSRFEAIKSIEGFVGEHLDTLLKPVNESWQPSDFLPNLSKEGWLEDLQEFREKAANLPDELLVVLVGDMVTEEALPTYQSWINRLEGVADPTGASDGSWARWGRGWTAEENRHGDLLNRYLSLSGRVDMRAVEVTIHHLINRGFDPQTDNDPYLGFIYTSFQERATKISHRNVAKLAKHAGEERLHEICGLIAGDEARHEKAYKLFMSKIFEIDTAEAVRAFATMMKRKIVMPAVLMRDSLDENLFSRFSRVAQRTGVYTAKDYADIVEDLVEHWKISTLHGLSDLAAEAQEYLCTLAERYRNLSDRIKTGAPDKFSWIFGRQVGGSNTY